MLLAGDEVLATKQGNNNTYCQNNDLSWFDWARLETYGTMRDFVRGMIRLRRRHPSLTRNRFLTGQPEPGQTLPDICWHGVGLEDPGWSDPNGRTLAFTLAGVDMQEPPLHAMFNMWEDALEFALPTIPGRRWYLAADTNAESGVYEPGHQEPVETERLRVGGRSIVVLEAHPG
jgi:isoamylase